MDIIFLKSTVKTALSNGNVSLAAADFQGFPLQADIAKLFPDGTFRISPAQLIGETDQEIGVEGSFSWGQTPVWAAARFWIENDAPQLQLALTQFPNGWKLRRQLSRSDGHGGR